MISLSSRDGKRHAVAADEIRCITEAGLSSRWHGIRAYVKLQGGETLEVQETLPKIQKAVEEELHKLKEEK